MEGLREFDRRFVIRLYERAQAVPDSTNAPVVTSRLNTAVTAAITRGDTHGQVTTLIAKTVAEAYQDMETVEGKSDFCYALLKLSVDSSKLGKVAAAGSMNEETEFVFSEKGVEIVTSEWRKHLKTRMAWMNYLRKLRDNARKYSRYGLSERISKWWDWIDENEDWTFCQMLVIEYMEKHRGRLAVAEDSELFLRVWRLAYSGSLPALNPPPAALHPPQGAIEQPRPAASTTAAPGTIRSAMENTVSRLSQELDQLYEKVQNLLSNQPTPPPPPAPPAPRAPRLATRAPAPSPTPTGARSVPTVPAGRRPTPRAPAAAPEASAAAPAGAAKKRSMSGKRLERFLEFKERAAQKERAAAAQAPVPEPPPAPPPPSPPTGEAAPAAAARKRRKRSRQPAVPSPPPSPPSSETDAAEVERDEPPTPPVPTAEPAPPVSTAEPSPAPEEPSPATEVPARLPAVPEAAIAPAVDVTPPPGLEPTAAAGTAPEAAPTPPAPGNKAGSWAERTKATRPKNDPRPLPPVKVHLSAGSASQSGTGIGRGRPLR